MNWFKKKYNSRTVLIYTPVFLQQKVYQQVSNIFTEGTVQCVTSENKSHLLINPYNRIYISSVSPADLKEKAMWLGWQNVAVLLYHPVDIEKTRYENAMALFRKSLSPVTFAHEMELKMIRTEVEYAMADEETMNFYKCLKDVTYEDFNSIIRMDINLIKEDVKLFCEINKCDSAIGAKFQKCMLKPKNFTPEHMDTFAKMYGAELSIFQNLYSR